MFDCANVEMRERLPELAAGTLDAAERARVEAHVATCTECASELETLRLVRAAFASAPGVDTRRIVASLPRPNVATPMGVDGHRRVRHWMGWRIAAALTLITVGGLSVAVTQRLRTPPGQTQATVRPQPDSGVVAQAVAPGRSDTGGTTVPRMTRTNPAPAPRQEKAQLSFGGGVDDLDRASIEALIGALDEIDRAPVAPSVEPDRVPVLPIISEGTR